MEKEKNSWLKTLFAYAEGQKTKLIVSVILSIISVTAGLVPFYCMYKLICLFVAGTVTKAAVVKWCLISLAAYLVKVVMFTLSTGVSHNMA